jgi:hypothetical protein
MSYKIWECKIVVTEDSDLPDGFDAPPRRAAIKAVEKAGITVIDCFSGWGGSLTDVEKVIVDYDVNRDRD